MWPRQKSEKHQKIRLFWHQWISNGSVVPRYSQKSKNLKGPEKSGRFDTSGSPVAFFVPEISASGSFVTRGGMVHSSKWIANIVTNLAKYCRPVNCVLASTCRHWQIFLPASLLNTLLGRHTQDRIYVNTFCTILSIIWCAKKFLLQNQNWKWAGPSQQQLRWAKPARSRLGLDRYCKILVCRIKFVNLVCRIRFVNLVCRIKFVLRNGKEMGRSFSAAKRRWAKPARTRLGHHLALKRKYTLANHFAAVIKRFPRGLMKMIFSDMLSTKFIISPRSQMFFPKVWWQYV